MDFNIRQDFSGDDYDEEAVESYTEGLFARFVRSPEAAALDADEDDFDGFFWSNPLIQYGIDYRSVTPATMRPADFEEVLFRVFPRKVSVDASKAEEIVIELRAFWRFLQREFGLENAAECLSILDDGAIAKLRRKLVDPSNFGMAKSFFAEGEAMGFDMETAALALTGSASSPTSRATFGRSRGSRQSESVRMRRSSGVVALSPARKAFAGRGLLPSGLVEEIRALAQPPIPWDVELARWFDGWLAPREHAFLVPRGRSLPFVPRGPVFRIS